MALSIGTLVGYLDLDDTSFERKAERDKQTMAALKLQLDAMAKSNPKIQAEVNVKKEQLDRLEAQLAELRERAKREGITEEVRVDAVRAKAQLAELRAEIAKINGMPIAPPVSQESVNGMQVLLSAAVALGPALIPLGAGLSGLGAGGIAAALGLSRVYKESYSFHTEVDAASKSLSKLELASGRAIAPALTTSLKDLLTTFPELRTFLQEMSQDLGGLAEEGSAYLVKVLPSILDYIRQEMPEAIQTIKDFAGVIPSIANAAAPLGAAVLPVLDDIAKALNVIGNSPIGPVVYDSVAAFLAFRTIIPILKSVTEQMVALKAATLGVAEADATAAGSMTLFSSAAAEEGGAGAAGAAGAGLSGGAAGAIAGVAAVLSPSIVQKELFNRLSPPPELDSSPLTSAKNLSNITTAISNTTGLNKAAYYADPLAWLGFNPAHFNQGGDLLNRADTDLQGMVDSGQSASAAKVFAQITDAAKKAGISVDTVNSKFPLYAAAVKTAGFANDDLSSSAKKATKSIQGLTNALAAEHARTLANSNARIAYNQALADTTKQADNVAKGAKGTAKGIDLATAAGRANLSSINALISAYDSQGRATKDSISGYDAARSALNRLMSQMGLTRDQIAQLDKALDKPADLRVRVQGLAQVAAIKNMIDQVHSKEVTITTRQAGVPAGGSPYGTMSPQQAVGHATGGRITGPGGPRDDKIPTWLSNGEFVVNAASTQRYLPMLEAINNAARMADGGQVKNISDKQLHELWRQHPALKVPVFTTEGPAHYAAAYRHNKAYAIPPLDPSWPYQSSMKDQKQERSFENWVWKNKVPFDPDAHKVDYDMRGYWLKTHGKGWHGNGQHFPDTFKTPYDTTFSEQSKYATAANPFFWHGNRLIDVLTGKVEFAASGGTVGGKRSPYMDRILMMLAPGEEVISNRNGQADRFRPLLKAINASPMADGGTVQASTMQAFTANNQRAAGNADMVAALREVKNELRELRKNQQHVVVDNHQQVAGSVQDTAQRVFDNNLNWMAT